MSLNHAYFFVFSGHFDRDKGLDMGRLTLNHLETGIQDIWIASSSSAGRQYPENFHKRGGFLPPTYRTKNVKKYEVETKPLNLKHVKGCEGNFYKITPFKVETDQGGTRSDFGIHLDANKPGSLGCIVMDLYRFQDFEKTITLLRHKGNIKSIPLFNQYS